MLHYECRKMSVEDLPEVLNNERSGYAHPWSRGLFLDCLVKGQECWLAVCNGKVVGHGLLSVAAGEAHLLNVCIHPDSQGLGLGKRMVEHLLGRARVKRAGSVFLEVRPSNLIACRLYENMGFNQVAVRPDYYPAYGGREDALVFAKELL